MYKIGDVAKLSGVSVRTLHHYEAKGLLLPSTRSSAAHRLYSDEDLRRLQQILFYKTLDFSLDEIIELMTAPNFNRLDALREQRARILKKREQMQALLELIEKTIQATGDDAMNNSERFAAFAEFDPEQFEEEVQERWGDTQAYRISNRLTKGYSKTDWQTIRAESEGIIRSLAALMKGGASPQDPAVLDAIEKYRLHIDRWYYPCDKSMHAELGQMYVSDQRFTEFYEKIQTGLAQYLCDATQANLKSE